MSFLVVERLRKSYGERPAVADVSFMVAAGEVFGLLGPNGAGKTTTMSVVCGLLPRDGGEVRLDGRSLDVYGHELGRHLGFVPQELALYPDLTARENAAFFGRLHGLKGRRLRARVDELLERVGLAGRADDRVENFSGGMKRRLNFVVALLHEPRLVILDEPTVGVDPQSRSHLLDLVRELAGAGVAVVYASHYMEEVQAVCDRVAILDHGRVLALDTLPGLLGLVERAVHLRVTGDAGLSARIGETVTGAGRSEETGEHEFDVVIGDTSGERSDASRLAERLGNALQAVTAGGGRVLSIRTREPSLERLFLELTGRGPRD